MNRFGAWLFNFMRGRYGLDELGRHLGMVFVGLIIASVIIGVAASLVYDLARSVVIGSALGLLSNVVNWASLAVLIWTGYRVLSRDIEKRRAENERYLARKAKRGGKRGGDGSGKGGSGWRGRGRNGRNGGRGAGAEQDLSREAAGYTYLTCPFCGQNMRVPQGKGKLAVKCPSCGEKTIVNS